MNFPEDEGPGRAPLILYARNGYPVVVPAHVADLFRDLPPTDETLSSYEEDEEPIGSHQEEEFDDFRVEVQCCGFKHPSGETHVGMNYFNSIFWTQLKENGGKLLPFLTTLALYFFIFIPEDSPSWGATVIKCLPILSLALFVFLNGVSQASQFNRRIFAALLFSCLGDLFLIWPGYFLHGIAAFGVAQVFYIRAFGFQPINMMVGGCFYAFGSTVLLLIGPSVFEEPWPLVVGVLIYSSLLTCMAWRASVRLVEECNWSSLFGTLGAISFMVSDTVLSVNRFYSPVPHHQMIIMTTYYFAQFSLSLTILKPSNTVTKSD